MNPYRRIWVWDGKKIAADAGLAARTVDGVASEPKREVTAPSDYEPGGGLLENRPSKNDGEMARSPLKSCVPST